MNEIIHTFFDQRGAPILTGFFLFLYVVESVSVLRARKSRKVKRTIINVLVAIPGFIGLRLLLLPAMVYVAYRNQEWQFGLNYLYDASPWVESIIAFVLLDYSNYAWHIANHKLPLLWRFHLVHHTDVDLDVTTAVRFHIGEMVTSVFFRGLAVLIVGASPFLVIVYEIVFEMATQFHHSNWRLPFVFEKFLNYLIVTPRMHGIHHSVIRAETDSNYSVIFSVWDRLHGTLNIHVRQNQINIGVPSYNNPGELTISYLLKLPFTRIREWNVNQRARGLENKNEMVE